MNEMFYGIKPTKHVIIFAFMISQNIKDSLNQMEFGTLRELIDYCLNNVGTIDRKYLPLVTNDIDKISKYIDILESKKRGISTPKPLSPPTLKLSITVESLKKESEAKIAEKKRLLLERWQQLKSLEEELETTQKKRRDLQSEDGSLNKKLVEFESEVSSGKDNLNSSSPESEIQKRLLYWVNKMQGLNQDSNKSEKDKIISKIKTVRIELDSINGKLKKLNKSVIAESNSHRNLLMKFNQFVKQEKSRNFQKEVEKENRERQELIAQKYNNLQEKELKNSQNSIHSRIIQRLRADVANFSSDKLKAQILNWKLLPTGEMPFVQVRKYLQTLSRYAESEFDYEKIDKITSLKADEIYCGTAQFEGYLVFYFAKIKIAVLDCPRKGNAIYIFGDDWKTLSRKTKAELLNYYPNKTERIIHRGDWFERLKSLLKYR